MVNNALPEPRMAAGGDPAEEDRVASVLTGSRTPPSLEGECLSRTSPQCVDRGLYARLPRG